ncbi:MAG: hypothetical protein R3E76_12710 [Planctomycetota bacterium]
MMKWMQVSLTALLLSALAIPAMAQETTEEARTVMLKESFKAGYSSTETAEESNTTEVSAQEMVVQTETNTETETKITDVLEVNEKGKITKARIRWTEGTTTTEKVELGKEPEDAVTVDSELTGASILYTWNAEKKAWEAKLEEGDADLDDVKKQMKKTDPFVNPFVPDREVKIGESWDADAEGLKALFSGDEGIKLKAVTATCKAEEIVTEKEMEYLKVSIELTMTGELQDENIGKPEITATRKGHYLYDIAEGRIVSIELDSEGSFDAEVQTPQGKMALTVGIAGNEKRAITYGETEAKEDEDK